MTTAELKTMAEACASNGTRTLTANRIGGGAWLVVRLQASAVGQGRQLVIEVVTAYPGNFPSLDGLADGIPKAYKLPMWIRMEGADWLASAVGGENIFGIVELK